MSEPKFEGRTDDKKVLLRLSKKTWKELRELAFKKNCTISDLLRQGANNILEKNKKLLDKNSPNS